MENLFLRSYMRLIYRRVFEKMSFYLVLSAILGGLYKDRLHFIYGLSFFGALCILLGWGEYLRSIGVRLPNLTLRHQKRKIPYALRRFKIPKYHKPSFMMDFNDFDDDLTPMTAVSEAQFTRLQCLKADMWAKLICGSILTLLSLVIQP